MVVTGVRWAESANRKNTHDVVDIRGKKAKKKADAMGVEYKQNKHGDVILNDDNDENRRMVEQCYRTHKTILRLLRIRNFRARHRARSDSMPPQSAVRIFI